MDSKPLTPAAAEPRCNLHCSVAIATWNRAALLAKTLASMLQVRVPLGLTFDVAVCDNNSTDDTRQVVESFIPQFNDTFAEQLVRPLAYLFEPQQGKSHALNRLLQHASGDWILFADDDVLIDEGWFEAFVAGMKQYPRATCLGGAMDPWLTRPVTPRQKLLLEKYPEVFAVLPLAEDRPIDAQRGWAAGANLALKRSAIPSTGFDTTLGPCAGNPVNGEDEKMVQQVISKGGEGWILAAARVKHYIHPTRLNMRYLWRWQSAVGRSWLRSRGRPTPGKFGVPWWAWREYLRRAARALMRWRPWPSETFYQAFVEAAQYWGYLRSQETGHE